MDIMRLIPRNSYMEKIINVIGTPDIKVITGVRRCGKSKLLESFKKYIDENIQDANIIHINFNLPEFEELLTFRALYEHINSLYKENMQNFVLIDEVQMCEDFEKAINGLHASEKYDIYITGSNAFLLSSDLATLFTGRTFEIKVFPFSFKEYVRYFDLSDRYEALSSYIKEGGMAGSYLYKDPEEKYDYIADVFDTLIVRDISMNEKIHHTTVGSYMQYLCNAFAFYKIRRYDIKGKKYLSSNDKYYLSDHTFRYAKLGTRNMDYGRILENIVAIELLRRGYEVYVGVLYKKEIDFVAIKRSEKIYIQVSDNISDDKTFEREVSPLLQIKDAYPKMLIARTRNDEYQYEGIKIFDLADWLLET